MGADMRITKEEAAESLVTFMAELSTPLPGSPWAEYESMKEVWSERHRENT